MPKELNPEVYRLVLRRTTRGSVVQFRGPGLQGREATLIRVSGRRAEELFSLIAASLETERLAENEVATANYASYRLRPEVGAAVGGLLIMARRSKNPAAWASRLAELVKGDGYVGSHDVLAAMFDLSLQLSRLMPPSPKERMQLNPRVLDALSAGMKVIARMLWDLRVSPDERDRALSS
ncbi:MAG: hypothetical protein CISAcid_10990 [uncultured Acidilobus sp. CIS]|jgi:hypothetical protein|nr:MAG: hypothetical protein CISAcid_10990 [uncultured Acidilobus sp. CIS]NAZ39097.1 hypothetical protein [Acidilobus sp.]